MAAARGIGAAVARGGSRTRGWQVIAADRGNPRAAAAPVAGGCVVRCDVSRPGTGSAPSLDGLRGSVGRLDALVCNAGIMVRRRLGELPLDEWNRVLATNLTGAFLLVRAAEDLLRAGGGAVVRSPRPARACRSRTETYSASKGGLVALTHALAVSLGPECG